MSPLPRRRNRRDRHTSANQAQRKRARGRRLQAEILEDRRLLTGGVISGLVWHDMDRDGTQGAGEPGLSGWSLYLDQNNNGSFDAGELTVTTGPDGRYEFTGVESGTQIVR